MTPATQATRRAKAKQPERDRSKPSLPLLEKLRWNWRDTCGAVDLCENTIRTLIRREEFPPPIELEGRQQFLPAEVKAWAACADWCALVAQRAEGAADA